jgi:hypothetical protein
VSERIGLPSLGESKQIVCMVCFSLRGCCRCSDSTISSNFSARLAVRKKEENAVRIKCLLHRFGRDRIILANGMKQDRTGKLGGRFAAELGLFSLRPCRRSSTSALVNHSDASVRR